MHAPLQRTTHGVSAESVLRLHILGVALIALGLDLCHVLRGERGVEGGLAERMPFPPNIYIYDFDTEATRQIEPDRIPATNPRAPRPLRHPARGRRPRWPHLGSLRLRAS